MLQTNNTGVCSQCLSLTGPAPAHGAHHSGSTLLHREPSEASPRLHAPPWSKPLRLGAQVALRGADSVGPAFCALGFPGGSEIKASASNVGDLGSIPGLGRSLGEGNGNPLQYSCLENPMDGEA